jgi:hypothetical protein
MTFSIMAHSKMALSIMTLSIITDKLSYSVKEENGTSFHH